MANFIIKPFGEEGELPNGYPITDDLDTNDPYSALSAAQGYVLNNRLTAVENADPQQADIVIVDGKQAYGTVGNAIQFGNLTGCSYAYIPKSYAPVIATMTTDASANVSSYIQYVDASGKVNSRSMTIYTKGNTYRVPLMFGSQDAGAYITFVTNSLSIEYGRATYPHLGFVDFGMMPSCVYGETGCFLGDGLTENVINANDWSGAANVPQGVSTWLDTRVKYADVIAKYDALVSDYPTYVEKHSCGNDASGTIPMFYYTFTPKYYTQHVYLQAGVHGWEPDAVFALAEIMYLIANAYGGNLSPKIEGNDALMFLRGHVKFTVFPVVNPWGFNRRSDCYVGNAGGEGGTTKRRAQNNYNDTQLNGSWSGSQAENVMVRNLLDSIASELSFAIDMHTTVWDNTRTKYGCFYGGVPDGAPNIRTMFRTWEWLYQFYNVKYPSIVDDDTCPNPFNSTYASVGVVTGTGSFRGWFYNRYGKPASTIEFSDHVWDEDGTTNYPKPLHTSAAMSVAVNMYLNHILQQVSDGYTLDSSTDVPQSDKYNTIG